MPTKLAIHTPPKMCLEREPWRAAFKKKITTQKFRAKCQDLLRFLGFVLFSLLPGTQEIITSRGEHRGPSLIFMSLKHSPPLCQPKDFR